MAPRKRKQPDKKRKAPPPSITMRGLGLAGRGLSAAGRAAARNPGIVGGSASFIVIFSFVAANALWYQPGAHPSPFLRTRVPYTFPNPAHAGGNATTLDPKTVTTFVIKREGEVEEPSPEKTATTEKPVETASVQPAQKGQTAAPQPAGDDVAAIIAGAATDDADPALIAAIQKELIGRGLYTGTADGKMGPMTEAAIGAFERKAGQPVTGQATEKLLSKLRAPQKTAAAKPVVRPYGKVSAAKGELDPVAAAIRQASIDPQYIPKADIPAASELVMNIQRGLVNLAYADVTVDGVAGEQTREAIRHFEKHYRLPPTGEPSETVLRKMKDIGAL